MEIVFIVIIAILVIMLAMVYGLYKSEASITKHLTSNNNFQRNIISLKDCDIEWYKERHAAIQAENTSLRADLDTYKSK